MSSNAKQVVQGYLNEFFSGNMDFDKVKSFLSSEEFTFDGPLMKASSADDYINQLKAMGPIQLKADVKDLLSDHERVAARLEFKTPFGNFPAAEWYWVKNGKLIAIKLHNDPRPFLEAFQQNGGQN